jgi:predicted outer membrane repeat protein
MPAPCSTVSLYMKPDFQATANRQRILTVMLMLRLAIGLSSRIFLSKSHHFISAILPFYVWAEAASASATTHPGRHHPCAIFTLKLDPIFLCLAAGGRGGAIYNDQSGWHLAPLPPHDVVPPVVSDSFVVNRSVFSGNSAAAVGGALAVTASCGPSVAATTFQGNSASSGGAIFVSGIGSVPCHPQNETVLNAVRTDRLVIKRRHAASWHSGFG